MSLGPRTAGSSPLDIVRASLRLPEIALEALGDLRPMRDELVRVREQTASMPALLPAIERMEQAIAPLDRRLGGLERTVATLAGEVAAMHRTLDAMSTALEQVPGVSEDDRGLLERARDAVTGGEADVH